MSLMCESQIELSLIKLALEFLLNTYQHTTGFSWEEEVPEFY